MADSDNILDSIGKEMKSNPPSIIEKTRRKYGSARAEKQRKAILLSKARNAGAKVGRKRG